MLVLAAGLGMAAAPLGAQQGDAGARSGSAMHALRAPALDPRLYAGLAEARRAVDDPLSAGVVEGMRSRLSFPALMLVGAAAGCVAGAVIMSSAGDVDDRETAAVRFNGCVLGGAAGMFLGGVYGLATGARMP